jgi:hypothetical protein
VHAVVQDVEGECARDDAVGDRFGEKKVGEISERRLESEEECGWHDESESVHW